MPRNKTPRGCALLAFFAIASTLQAAGPRWITGPPYFTVSGTAVVWYTNQPLYFTDPGDLSSTVDHASADALVAAAAAVWNAPTSALTLAQGGTLAEHPNEANTFLGPDGVIFPPDIQSSNYANIQIAILYDSDGSITDLLLGNGASDPSSCQQNGVTESVDSFTPTGYIQHAILVLNGRCTGSAPEAQLQLQYQLVRAFGRILGLGWSQNNDNVFTESPQPTYQQAMNWPIMHPIDIICGPYSYQCLPEPFTLRADDLSSLALLYPVPQNAVPAGKTDTLLNASEMSGTLTFPTGQGMQGVNITLRRWEQYTSVTQQEQWSTASAVSGAYFRQSNGNPVTVIDTSFAGSQGSTNASLEGYYIVGRIPMLPGNWQQVILETEPINPLYTGDDAVGPYTANTVNPSGSNPNALEGLLSSDASDPWASITITDAASTCTTPAGVEDGTESAPAAVASTGWWSSLLCGYGHTAWSSFSVRANRTFTIEVTAEDENGFASSAKAMPVIGLWNATDPTGTLPTVASAGAAFNGETTGTTTLSVSTTQPQQLRMVIADQRGDGRPDFNYGGRVLYADSLSPATLPAQGGTITITGTGFRPGNTVLIDGAPATVTSWSANTIVATAPSLQTLGINTALTTDVTVKDLSTGGVTTMRGALSYTAPAPYLTLLTAPTGTLALSAQSPTPFAVQILSANGITPVVGEAVLFTTTTGSVQFSARGASSCAVYTNQQGIASTLLAPTTTGAITLQATAADGTATASFTALADVRTITPLRSDEYIAAGATLAWPLQITLADNLASTTAVSVAWQSLSGPITASPAQTLTSPSGVARTTALVGAMAIGTQSQLTACAFTTLCTTFTAHSVDPSSLTVSTISGATQSIPATGTFAPVVLLITNPAGHPVAGAAVQIDQTVQAWQPACPTRGRCPIAPIESSFQQPLTSDDNGLVTVTPLQIAGTPGTTNLAAAIGSGGFVSLTLQSTP